jgi:hypothetical protein
LSPVCAEGHSAGFIDNETLIGQLAEVAMDGAVKIVDHDGEFQGFLLAQQLSGFNFFFH